MTGSGDGGMIELPGSASELAVTGGGRLVVEPGPAAGAAGEAGMGMGDPTSVVAGGFAADDRAGSRPADSGFDAAENTGAAPSGGELVEALVAHGGATDTAGGAASIPVAGAAIDVTAGGAAPPAAAGETPVAVEVGGASPAAVIPESTGSP